MTTAHKIPTGYPKAFRIGGTQNLFESTGNGAKGRFMPGTVKHATNKAFFAIRQTAVAMQFRKQQLLATAGRGTNPASQTIHATCPAQAWFTKAKQTLSPTDAVEAFDPQGTGLVTGRLFATDFHTQALLSSLAALPTPSTMNLRPQRLLTAIRGIAVAVAPARIAIQNTA